MKQAALSVLLLAVLSLFAACGRETGQAQAGTIRYTEITADPSGMISLSTEEITETACFYNYLTGSITVQLVAIRDSAGHAHIAFNTCQSCSPSPKAYYSQNGELLQCANCGFTFSPEEVGLVQGGCSPWPIEGVKIGPDEITLPIASLEAMASRFASWNGPLK